MSSWNETSRALPRENEAVRFLVSGHARPLLGVYENHSFRSRWGAYPPSQVGTWHRLGSAPGATACRQAEAVLATWSERPMREA